MYVMYLHFDGSRIVVYCRRLIPIFTAAARCQELNNAESNNNIVKENENSEVTIESDSNNNVVGSGNLLNIEKIKSALLQKINEGQSGDLNEDGLATLVSSLIGQFAGKVQVLESNIENNVGQPDTPITPRRASDSAIGRVTVSEEVEVDAQDHEHLTSDIKSYVDEYFDTAYLGNGIDSVELSQQVQEVAQLVVNYVATQRDQRLYERQLEISQQPITAMFDELLKLDVSADTDQKRALFMQASRVILEEPQLLRKMHLCMNTLVNAHNHMITLEKRLETYNRNSNNNEELVVSDKVATENLKDFVEFLQYLSTDLINEIRETDVVTTTITTGGTTTTTVKTIITSGSASQQQQPPVGFEHLVIDTQGASVDNTATTGNSTGGPAASKKQAWGPASVYNYSETDLVELNKYNFDRAIEENEFVCVLFYAPWCHRSQTITKEIEETRRIYRFNNSKVLFAKVNGHDNIEIRDKQSIGGYPVIQLYRRHGGNVIPRGPTHPYSLAALIRRSTLPPIEHIESMEQYEQFLKVAGHSFIGVFPNNATLEYHKFAFIAKKLSYKIPIGYVNNTELAKEIFTKHRFSTPISGIVLAIPQENIFYLNRCDVHDAPGVFKWLTLTQPSVNELTSDNLSKLANAKKPSVTLFLNYSNDMIQPIFDKPLSQHLLDIYTLAHEFKTTFDIYYTDGVSYRDFYEKLGITKIPSVAIIDVRNESHYIYPANQDININNIRKFLQDFLEHKLEPQHSSDRTTDYRQKPRFVSKAVYDNFGDIVLNSKKNTLVYFYEPWCGFCKTMNIYFEKAAEELVSKFGSFVQILDYDCSVNSVPTIMKPIIDGFPHISLFLGDDTQHPITYNGSRSVESIIHFVKSHIEKDGSSKKPTSDILEPLIDYQKISLEMAEKELQ
ncbi:hypothetical protein PPL_07922 [Heterostelium album PN500]|uniref:Thioredoxin domain-containing protein n=1 Tax=Heterostelium pallidum (strain ATCC 26659 / Pp 5 / PN500) TaxID=670386 RepID=D3BHC0_HETP5|nr:hypothetical protein PPL_07922 [Heterostelium album PN500]EFA79097.1 hypothetical protein PPL_07922 [Heterostelium album PN500]|eukprot:XP_020431219.1 hypothetical protein PPL_07922 [Heterostelium album PN500]